MKTSVGLAAALVIGVIIVVGGYEATVSLSGSSSIATMTTAGTGSTTTTKSTTLSSTAGLATSSQFPFAFTVNGTFVSRFCTNSSNIPGSSGPGEIAGLEASISGIGLAHVTTYVTNSGTTPVPVAAVCVDAVGLVPLGVPVAGPTATTIAVAGGSLNPIQPGQKGNITVLFGEGSEFFYMPQGGLGVTIIASDGSGMIVSGPVGGGFLTTASSPTPVASIINASLVGGKSQFLSASIRFNSTAPVSEVDFFVNGTYVGSAQVGHNATAQGAPHGYVVSYRLGILEQPRITIVSGHTYSLSVTAATTGYTETTMREILVAR
jgi:hypothetical protein